VNDPLTFVSNLRDPHQLGSEEPLVDQEPTLLERIATWKAARRETCATSCGRSSATGTRVARRQQSDREQVQIRQTTHVNTFAQVPLLNPSQLVTSWRELLPPVRDTEFRRIPLDLREPGMYVVEAINARSRPTPS